MQPAQSMVSKHIVIAHRKENLDWLDQLHTFDQSLFDPCRIHIHIYSKCGMEVDLKGRKWLTIWLEETVCMSKILW